METIRATDDEPLARQLWGANCEWDEDRKQFVPIEPKPAQPVTKPAEPVEYEALKVAELQAELAKRNERRTSDGDEPLPTANRRADLIALLKRDDTEREA